MTVFNFCYKLRFERWRIFTGGDETRGGRYSKLTAGGPLPLSITDCGPVKAKDGIDLTICFADTKL